MYLTESAPYILKFYVKKVSNFSGEYKQLVR